MANYLKKIVQKRAFPEELARHFFSQIFETLEFIHKQGLAHRDVKLENILLDENYNIKFCDFGFATEMAGLTGTGQLSAMLGSEAY